jgi:anti-anti-sigma factor
MHSPEFALSCDFDTRHSRHVVLVSGDIDVATVPAIRELLSTLDGDVAIDCAAVTFLDSAGIGLLIGAHAARSEHGHRLTIRKLSPMSFNVLKITGLTDVLHIEESPTPAA